MIEISILNFSNSTWSWHDPARPRGPPSHSRSHFPQRVSMRPRHLVENLKFCRRNTGRKFVDLENENRFWRTDFVFRRPIFGFWVHYKLEIRFSFFFKFLQRSLKVRSASVTSGIALPFLFFNFLCVLQKNYNDLTTKCVYKNVWT